MPAKSITLILCFTFVDVQLSGAMRIKKRANNLATRASRARIGLEVEFADGKMTRTTTDGDCEGYLEYGAPWFQSEEATNQKFFDEWKTHIPKLKVESEVKSRNTIELITGPIIPAGENWYLGEIAFKILRIAKALLSVPEDDGIQNSGLRKHSKFEGDLSQLQPLINHETGYTMQPSGNIENCLHEIKIKVTGPSPMTAGIHVNFEMRPAQVLKLAKDGPWSYFGSKWASFWNLAGECLAKYAQGKNLTDRKKGAYLIAFHQSAVVAYGETVNQWEGKNMADLLPKVLVDEESERYTQNTRTLKEITAKGWTEIKGEMNEIQDCKQLVPKTWRPDEKMFAKSPPGIGGPADDPYIIMEQRNGAGGMTQKVKEFFSAGENRNVDLSSIAEKRKLDTAAKVLQDWAFGTTSNVQLQSSSSTVTF